MSVTAKRLSKNGTRGREVDALIREHLQMIDAKLGQAVPTWGVNVVRIELPATFSLPGLEKKDAQRVVYSSIITSLKDRDFTVGLELSNDKAFLDVGWVREFNEEELDAMNRQIADALVDNVDAFRHRVATTATPIRTARAEKLKPAAQAAAEPPKPSAHPGALPSWANGV
jgi:hypothetical protein